MIIPRHKGSVAKWTFENGLIQQLNWQVLEQSLTSCATVASILSSYKLLSTNTIRLSVWMRAGEQNVSQSKRIEKADISFSVDPSNPFMDTLSLCHSILDSEYVYPLTVEILGLGAIVTDHGEIFVDDLVWLRARTMDTFNISVVTQSDVWLPFSLQGEPQHAIYSLNADRLTNALQEIHQQIGFDLEEGVESYYSVIKGFRLENIRYADGSIADVS